jgi:hypothetical protein
LEDDRCDTDLDGIVHVDEHGLEGIVKLSSVLSGSASLVEWVHVCGGDILKAITHHHMILFMDGALCVCLL